MNCRVGRTVALTGAGPMRHNRAQGSLPSLFKIPTSSIVTCLGENHLSVKQATGIKRDVCVLLVAALSVV